MRTHVDDEERYRPRSRSAFSTALATLGLAGILGLLGYSSMAIGLAVFAGASLAWAAIYSIMYRV